MFIYLLYKNLKINNFLYILIRKLWIKNNNFESIYILDKEFNLEIQDTA